MFTSSIIIARKSGVALLATRRFCVHIFVEISSTTGSRRRQKPCACFTALHYHVSKGMYHIPPTTARDLRRKTALVKCHVRHTRGSLVWQQSDSKKSEVSIESTQVVGRAFTINSSLKRQRSAFIMEEELQCMLEDQIDTPHISELQLDEDIIAHSRTED